MIQAKIARVSRQRRSTLRLTRQALAERANLSLRYLREPATSRSLLRTPASLVWAGQERTRAEHRVAMNRARLNLPWLFANGGAPLLEGRVLAVSAAKNVVQNIA